MLNSPFAYNAPSLQLEKCKYITYLFIMANPTSHSRPEHGNPSPCHSLFKRPHHETLNTPKPAGTGIILTLTWQIPLHTDVEFNALCGFRDAIPISALMGWCAWVEIDGNICLSHLVLPSHGAAPVGNSLCNQYTGRIVPTNAKERFTLRCCKGEELGE